METVLEDDPVVQMITCLPGSLKKRGDAALAKAGFTPSQAVREVWSFAAQHADDPEAIRRYFRPDAVREKDEMFYVRSPSAPKASNVDRTCRGSRS